MLLLLDRPKHELKSYQPNVFPKRVRYFPFSKMRMSSLFFSSRLLIILLSSKQLLPYQLTDYLMQKVCVNEYQKSNQKVKLDRKSTRLNSSHVKISYAVFCLK